MKWEKQIVIDIDGEKRLRFKTKLASESLTMREVLTAAIDDYLSGKYKPSIKKGVKKAA